MEFLTSFLTEENLCAVCLSAPPNCFWISQSISITLSGGGVKILQILHSLTFKENRSQGKRHTQMCAPMRKICRLIIRQSTWMRKIGKQFSSVLQSVVLFVLKIRLFQKVSKNNSGVKPTFFEPYSPFPVHCQNWQGLLFLYSNCEHFFFLTCIAMMIAHGCGYWEPQTNSLLQTSCCWWVSFALEHR